MVYKLNIDKKTASIGSRNGATEHPTSEIDVRSIFKDRK